MRPALQLPAALAILLLSGAMRAQNAHLLLDSYPGIGSSMREWGVASSTRYGEVLLAMSDQVHGMELWRSDGTAAGTRMVRELTPGSAESNITYLTTMADGVWFSLVRPIGDQIWRSDGTTAGTQLIVDGPNLGMVSILPPVWRFTDGSVLLAADGGYWRTDGTAGGTVQLGIPDGYFVHAVGDEFWILGYQPPFELWHSRGTPSTSSAVATQVIWAAPHLGGMVVFEALGTTQTVISLLGTANPQTTTLPEVAIPALIDGAVLARGTHTLWRWDAQGPPTVLHVFASLPAWHWGFETAIPGIDGIYFEADDGVHGEEIWFTDGTASGTHLFMDLTPGPASTLFDGFSFLVQGKAVTWMDAAGLNLGLEPWVTDGTVAGTLLLGDLAPGPAGSAPDYEFGSTGPASQRRMIGMISTPQYGAEPWVTDGTPGGTHLVADINPGPNPSMGMFGYHAMHVGPDPVFVANDGVHGYEPWVIQLEGVAAPLVGGCSPDGRYSVADPVLGTPWQLASSWTLRTGVALLSLPSSTPIDVGGACLLQLDLSTSVVLAVIAPNAAGEWTGSFPLPSTTNLRGARLVSQAAYLSSVSPFGFDLADAWSVTLGL
ncbi:MAG: hypothetical protein U1F36_23305 [Planctomycetota bacterium]